MSRLDSLRLSIILALLCLAGLPVAAQSHETHGSHPDHVMITTDDHAWSDGPASLPPGARAMVIEGNPAVAGEFTMRLWLPANYEICPHFHPADEHVTVISGAFYMGLGDEYDPTAAQRLPPGGFAMMRKGTSHFAFTKEETVVQLHGVGPWGLTYVDPSNDPRAKSE